MDYHNSEIVEYIKLEIMLLKWKYTNGFSDACYLPLGVTFDLRRRLIECTEDVYSILYDAHKGDIHKAITNEMKNANVYPARAFNAKRRFDCNLEQKIMDFIQNSSNE